MSTTSMPYSHSYSLPFSCSYAAPLGRLLLSSIFLLSAAHKFTDWEGTVQLMANQGVVAPHLLLPIAVALELGGGIFLLLGCYARWGAVALLIFLLPVTLIMHDFWQYAGDAQQQQMINFMKNIAIMGGLLFVVAFGAGPWSVDAARQTPSNPGRG